MVNKDVSSQPTPHTTKNNLLPFLKWVVRIVVYLPLTLVVILALALGTDLGSKSIIGIIDKSIDSVSMSHNKGSLNDNISLKHFSLLTDGIEVRLENLELFWQPLCLLKKQICVKNLKATKVSVNISALNEASNPVLIADDKLDALSSGNQPSQPNTKQGFKLPFSIQLSEANLKNVQVKVNEMTFTAERLQSSADWNKSGLTVSYITSQSLAVLIPTSPKDKFSDEKLAVKSQLTQQRANSIGRKINLPSFQMPFDLWVKKADLLDSKVHIGGINEPISRLTFTGQFIKEQLTIKQLNVDTLLASAELKGQLKLIDDYPIQAQIKVDIFPSDNISRYAEGGYSLSFLSKNNLFLSLADHQIQLTANQNIGALNINAQLNGKNSVSLKGQLAPLTADIPFSLDLTDGEYIGRFGQHAVQINKLDIRAKGDLLKQQVTLSSSAIIDDKHFNRLSTSFENINSAEIPAKLTIEQFELVLPSSNIDITGQINYEDKISWDTEINSLTINLEELFTVIGEFSPRAIPKELLEYTGSIKGRLASKGFWQPTQPHIAPTDSLGQSPIRRSATTPDPLLWLSEISDVQLNGHINNLPFMVQGSAKVDSNLTINSPGLLANALGATLNVSGDADKKWQLTSTLFVADFSYWHPDASGSLQAQFDVKGDKSNPQIILNASATNVKFEQLNIQNGQIEAAYLPAQTHQYNGLIKSNNISYQGVKLDRIQLESKGNIEQQTLDLQTAGDIGIDMSMRNNASNEKKWLTEVSHISITTDLGQWLLDRPIKLAWDNQEKQGVLSPFCLSHPHNSTCLSRSALVGQRGDIQMTSSGNIGKLLVSLIPKSIVWDGDVDITLNSTWRDMQKPAADLRVKFAPGKFIITQDQTHQIDMDYQSLVASLQLNEQQIHSLIQFESQHIASIDSEVTIQVSPDREMSGFANINNIDLQAFSSFWPKAETLAGNISSQLKLGGSLDKPKISGNINLVNGQLASKANPTLLDNIELTANLAGEQANILGKWQMGQGHAQVNGQLNWPNGKLNGKVSVSGEKLALIQPPTAILAVTPELEITFSPTHTDVKGKIVIPSGKITIEQLPEGAVDVSQDVVFDDSIANKIEQQPPITFAAQIQLSVEDNVKISGLGLQGQLKGILELEQKTNQPPFLFGNMSVINGSYKFMGQTLAINTGELQFIGPAEIPNLNIEAVREIKTEDIVAGVRVTGTPNKPIVTLFSSPHKEQAEILSYIVKGTGLNNQSSDPDSLMMGAAIGLGSHLGGEIIEGIGSRATGLAENLGFKNVQLDSNDEGRIAISGYIGEDLMVKYGVGVLDAGYEMTVRYFLLSQLYLETVSGTLGQSLDIYYNFDID